MSFLTNLGTEAVDCAVDVNPTKHGFFMAGTGHEILSPEQLLDRPPELVVVMNPIYLPEITQQIRELGLDAEVLAV